MNCKLESLVRSDAGKRRLVLRKPISERARAIARARSQSKRYGTTMMVEHVVKGRGKGSYEATEKGSPRLWCKGLVVEVVVTYKNGKKV